MYNSIQACRAIAAILVVCFHLAGNLAKDKYFGPAAEPLERFFSFGGTAGVAFFFVLSGFIIAFIHRSDFGRPDRLLAYLRKRAVRIYPSYLIVFAGVYLLALMVPSLRDSVPSDVGVLFKSLLLVPQDPAVTGGTGAPVIVVAWSLQYELVFYAAVALGIVHPMLFVAAVAAFALNLGWQWFTKGNQFPATFFASYLMLLFGLGMVTAWVVQKGRPLRRPLPVAVVAGMLFFAIGAVADWLGFESYKLLFSFGYGLSGSLAIVSLIQAERERPQRFQNRAVAMLGDASYALYLIHFPLIAVLCKLAVAAGLRGIPGIAVSFVGILVVCVAVSVLFHLLVERPVLRALSARARPDVARPTRPSQA